jgi:hypothetical protein
MKIEEGVLQFGIAMVRNGTTGKLSHPSAFPQDFHQPLSSCKQGPLSALPLELYRFVCSLFVMGCVFCVSRKTMSKFRVHS